MEIGAKELMSIGPLYSEYNRLVNELGDSENNKAQTKLMNDPDVISKSFLGEILWVMIQPIPFWDKFFTGGHFQSQQCNMRYAYAIYRVNDVLLALMFCRIYFVIKFLLNQTIYTDAYSMYICRKFGFQSNVRFAIKCLFVQRPITTFNVFFWGSIFIFSYLIRICEMPTNLWYRVEDDRISSGLGD